MTKKQYIQVGIMSIIILIGGLLFTYYYREYISPKSFVVGDIAEGEYKQYVLKEYLSDDDIIFCQNINDVSFVCENSVATYEYMFESANFDGINEHYTLFINDVLVTDVSVDAGLFTGNYILKFFDIDRTVMNVANIRIDFSFYSLSSKLRVSLRQRDLPFLYKYFRSDNFVITLSRDPYVYLSTDNGVADNSVVSVTYLLDGEVVDVELVEKGSNFGTIGVHWNIPISNNQRLVVTGYYVGDTEIPGYYKVNEDMIVDIHYHIELKVYVKFSTLSFYHETIILGSTLSSMPDVPYWFHLDHYEILGIGQVDLRTFVFDNEYLIIAVGTGTPPGGGNIEYC